MSEDQDREEPKELPQIDFTTFVLSLSHSAFVHLGDVPGPNAERVPPNLVLARQSIDILSLLEEKTKGNLNGEEERLLEQVIYELRMRYIEVAKGEK